MTAESRPKKIILAAGGTGGHIWPALSFGAWINKNHAECEVRYVCGSRPLEREIYAAAKAEPVVLPSTARRSRDRSSRVCARCSPLTAGPRRS